tara:strand:+ start:268 stop:444 length:177 start_codon:yes stop_codon:yes gene_type:complete
MSTENQEKKTCNVCKATPCKCELYTGVLELDPLMVYRILQANKLAEAEDGLQSQKTAT